MTQTTGRADNAKPKGDWACINLRSWDRSQLGPRCVITDATLCGGVHQDSCLGVQGTKANQYQRRILINERCKKQVVQGRLEGWEVEGHSTHKPYI